jgi:[ribosomal protein S5]-alanine N-acetyltransferase
VTTLELETERLTLSLPQASHVAAALDFHTRSRAHLKPWSPPLPAGFDTLPYWQNVVEISQEAFVQGTLVRLWISPKAAPDLVIGTVGFSQIFRGPFCSGVLGYQIDAAHEGQGLMREALQTSVRYMFDEQKLHRIGANYRPENIRSGRLLQRLGFRIEGFSKRYLFIDGDWRDHILTSLTNDQFKPEWLSAR